MQQCWIVFVNRVGTEAGVGFWGGSRVIDPSGEIIAQAPFWEPALITVDVDVDVDAAHRRRRELPLLAEARLALVGREVVRLVDDGGDT